MTSLIELLQQAQKELACPTCGRRFHLSEIRPRNHINNTIMLQAICTNNHFPIVLMFIPSKSLPSSIQPLKKNDVAQLAKTLDSFDGLFSKAWQVK